MKHKKWLLAGATGLLALGLVGCGANEKSESSKSDDKQESTSKKHDKKDKKKDKDSQTDVTKYTASPKDLAKQFTSQFKGYQVSEIDVDTENGETVYEIKGYNTKENMEATLEVSASKTTKVVRKESETMDSEDKSEQKAIDVNKVSVTPKSAMDTAKKSASLSTNPTDWTLKKNNDNKLVYVIEFAKDDKEVVIDANSGKKLAVEND